MQISSHGLIWSALALAGILGIASGCQRYVEPTAPVTGMYGPPLYDRLGGLEGIEAVVERFVENVTKDTRINGRFAKTDGARLKKLLVDQICDVADGTCRYHGRDMKTAHAGMKIANAEFNAMMEDLAAAMESVKVPKQEGAELLTLLRAMRDDVVEGQ